MYRIITIFTIAVTALLMSCVSAGRFDAMVTSRDSLQLVGDSLKRALADKENNINELNRQIEAHKEDIARLRTELKNLKENYSQLKSSSSNQSQDLLNQIEELQKNLMDSQEKYREIQNKLHARDSAMNALKTRLNDALLGFTNSGLSISIKNGKVYVSLSNQLLFQSGSTVIDKKGLEALKELSKVLNSQPEINVLVEGHTDNAKVINQTRFKDNWDLSVLRATEVVRYLTENCAVDPTRVTCSGRGEYFPIQAGDDPESRAMNRRTEIILTPKLQELFDIIDK